ncbi:MAG: sialate O-acetylesterase [Coleofasciculus sp. G3-WIS-01]|uniref:sialate O-acetylesterase n=1 Tax=Coleofasciculus sp. G3-WIS-01 TaxID=3069528 RepID=UPI00330349B2
MTRVQAFSLINTNSSRHPTPSIKLFILAGQSNMVGSRSTINDVPDSWLQPQDNVLWYDSDNTWGSLRVPTEPFPFSRVFNGVGFGPEITLGQRIAQELNETVALVKYAKGGTNLAVDWKPGGELYSSMMDRVNQAIAEFPIASVNVEIAGFFWMQGESDAYNLIMANQYEQNLTNFITQVRQDLHEPNLPFVYGKVFLTGTQQTPFGIFRYGDIIRQAQSQVSEQVPGTFAVETSDLSQHPDNIHFDSQGLMELGDRFAEEWLSIPEPSTLGFLSLSVVIFPLIHTSLKNKK